MKRFIEGEDRFQATLFPESLEDYIAEDSEIRLIDRFVDGRDLVGLGFKRATPSATGRPGYHPAVLLKIYVYGYMNRIQSSRRLERESHRNVELIWLTRRLMPDHKTIADFRRDNRKAIRRVCREFVDVCRELELFSKRLVAIDGSKFKAVNSRDKNFTRKSVKKRIQQTEANIERYLAKLDATDKEEPEIREVTAAELKAKIASMEAKLDELNAHAEDVEAHPDNQVSLTDPDARSMMKPGGGSVVGYNVQTAVDGKHHLIPHHEVTNSGVDRHQLSAMAKGTKTALGLEEAAVEDDTLPLKDRVTQERTALTVLADEGYYAGSEVVECVKAGIRPLVKKTDTSGKAGKGEFTKADFIYDAEADVYRCPAGEILPYKGLFKDRSRVLRSYRTFKCSGCALKSKCTPSNSRRILRYPDQGVIDAVQAELAKDPDAMRERKQLAEHPYGTIKHWMGSTHFLMKGLANVQAEMSLHVLAYNMKRAIRVLGVPAILEYLQAA
jgi:transposase